MATIDIKLKSYDELIFEITKLNTDKYLLEQENKQLKEQLEYLRSNEYLNQVKWERNFNEELVKDLQQKLDKATNINQYIIDYGFDYDGLNTIESLKGLIDMLVDYARQVKEILGDKENE